MVTTLKEEIDVNIEFLTEAKKQLTNESSTSHSGLVTDIDRKIDDLKTFNPSSASTHDVNDMHESVMNLLGRRDSALFTKKPSDDGL